MPDFLRVPWVEMGLPIVRYEQIDYAQDLQGIAEAERRFRAS